jgi:alkylated DNA repair protein alkB family protein 6
MSADESRSEEGNSNTELKKKEPVLSLILQPRSLLVVKDELYSDYLHSVPFRTTDVIDDKVINLELINKNQSNEQNLLGIGSELARETRLSLTIRVVEKVLKNVIKLR